MSYLGRTMKKTSDNSVQELARRVNDVLKKIDISQAIAWFAIMGLDIVDTFTPEEKKHKITKKEKEKREKERELEREEEEKE